MNGAPHPVHETDVADVADQPATPSLEAVTPLAPAPSNVDPALSAPAVSDAAPMLPTRIVIADDHPVVLFALESLISRFPYLTVVGRAHTFPELFNEAAQLDFDVAIVDLHMPCVDDLDARETLGEFRQRFPGASLVVLTTEADPAALRRVLDVKIDGILSKKDPIDLIPVAIVSAMAHERYVGPVVRDLLAHRLHAPAGAPARAYQLLSRREREVLALYASGMSVTEIAGQIGRSIKTISAQKCSAMKKLSLANDIELYRFAADCGFGAGALS
ncbi:MAG TPA: response regulator transcription factor [Paraburkholderia sp.]|jgi:two-component system capsular synthesis response regulator RcsB|nr:response regulator transcription factor [Paraburkholderia sp.]